MHYYINIKDVVITFSLAAIKHCRNHCVKSVRIPSLSGPYFPAFGLNAERYGLSLRIQSECGKMWTRKIPNTDTFYAVNNIPIPESPFSKTIVVSTHLNKIKNKQKKKKKKKTLYLAAMFKANKEKYF